MTINIDAKTWIRYPAQVSGGRFYSDVDKVPAAAISYSGAASDGNTLTIETDGTYAFGTGPFSGGGGTFVVVGFGLGHLAGLASGNSISSSFTCPITGRTITWDSSNAIRVASDATGIRTMRTQCGADTAYYGGGIIQTDSGGSLPNGSKILLSGLAKCTAAVNDNVQWKTFRARAGSNLNGSDNNSAYSKIFCATTETTSGEVTCYRNSVATLYGASHPAINGDWFRHDLFLNTGTAGSADGVVLGKTINITDASGFVGTYPTNSEPATGSAYLLTSDAVAERIRYVQIQDYFSANVGSTADGVDLHRADVLLQWGSWARVELANGATPGASTKAHILPPVTWSDTSVQVKAWKGLFSSYAGLYLHIYNDSGAFVAGVPI